MRYKCLAFAIGKMRKRRVQGTTMRCQDIAAKILDGCIEQRMQIYPRGNNIHLEYIYQNKNSLIKYFL